MSIARIHYMHHNTLKTLVVLRKTFDHNFDFIYARLYICQSKEKKSLKVHLSHNSPWSPSDQIHTQYHRSSQNQQSPNASNGEK